ncbi:MAG TPA: hypothetical protein PKU80_00275 [Candidatus Limiplasma sp.]|nr:hypothetical protein [Candidatus Limiplasma sp.]HRX09678.1 hypothetical protein [Candidatus Limiplasma sp.]
MIRCPRCELNYIADDEKLCKVCIREIKGGQKQDEIEPCSICNAAPALPGKDVCLGCYKELNSHQIVDRKHGASVDEEIELSSASTMDEIIPNVKEDMDDADFDDEDAELSLETIIEEEDDDDDDDDEDYD